jgi:hypothetical protein
MAALARKAFSGRQQADTHNTLAANFLSFFADKELLKVCIHHHKPDLAKQKRSNLLWFKR